MEYARFAFARPALRPALARNALPRVAPSTIASIVMEDLRPKIIASISETSASRIIAQWAAWRRQASEQMFSAALDGDIHDLASLQPVSTMLEASFLRARAAAEDETHVLCGWQEPTHVVMRELQGLSEHRAVSAFVHRDCIESYFRRRLLFCGVHGEGSVSMATRELGQFSEYFVTDDQATNRSVPLSEHHSFTDQVLRDDNHHLDNTTSNHEIHSFQPAEDPSVNVVQSTVPNRNDTMQGDTDQEQMDGYEYDSEYSDSVSSQEQGSEQSGSFSSSPGDNNVREEAGTYEQQNEGEAGAFAVGDDIDSQDDAEPPRRDISNLLSSGFRESLGQQLMQSYAQRQELGERQMPNTPASENEDHAEHGINESNQAGHDTTDQPSFVFTGQGPRRRQWHWTHPEFVIDAIQELQVEIKVMQQMLQACMEMHIELQRSVKQEVSAAMNRSTGVQGWAEGQPDDASRWHLVRKGTCCVCCDNQIDSLLYRCGHMCTCSMCANELLNREGKCPMCRAPIVEVVRAYTT